MKSMTGYGRSESETAGYEIAVEVRSVNHRFSEIVVRMPRSYHHLEDAVKAKAAQAIARGKAEITVTIQSKEGKLQQVQMNHGVVASYLLAMQAERQRLASEMGIILEDDVTLRSLMRIPDAFQVQPLTEETDVMWQMIEPVLDDALVQFLQMRETEGDKLRLDIAGHLAALEKMTKQVEVLSPQTVSLYYEKLYRKVSEILSDRTVDESRLVTEAAVVAEKIAVDEETVRMHSHIAQFRGFLEEKVPIGRKMDFLVQEMNREVNTMGSKAQLLEITKIVVEMKSEIEKIREQIQNVE